MLGQRPRATTPYRYSRITHQHLAPLSHFGRRERVAGARLCLQQQLARKLANGSSFQGLDDEDQRFCALARRDRLQTGTMRARPGGGAAGGDPGESDERCSVPAGRSAAAATTIALDASADSELF